jgi:riboflavin synthase alpha subunit
VSQLQKWAEQAIGSRNVRKLQEHGLTVVPAKLIEQLKSVKVQQNIVIEGVALTVMPFEEEHLETSQAGYVCMD